MAVFQQLSQGLGVDDDAGNLTFGLTQGGEGGAVAVVDAEVGAHQNDLVLEPDGGEELQGLGGKGAEGRRLGVGRGAPVQGNQGVGGGMAQFLGQGPGEAPDADALVQGPSGIDPAHRIADCVLDQVGEGAQARGDEGVEVFRLVFGQAFRGSRVTGDERNPKAFEGRFEGRVLGRFRRLIEQDIQADGADAAFLQGQQDVADETAVEGRTVGKLGQGVLGHRHDDDVFVLRLGRRQRGDTEIPQPLVRQSEKGQEADQGERKPGRDDQDGDKDRREPKVSNHQTSLGCRA